MLYVPTKVPKRKGKGKKGQGKKGKKEKPPEAPFDMTTWRQDNIPVASTRLWRSWFDPTPYQQRTPNLSAPPSPPGEVPEPVSQFGYFIVGIPQERHEKLVVGTGHYSPRLSSSFYGSYSRHPIRPPRSSSTPGDLEQLRQLDAAGVYPTGGSPPTRQPSLDPTPVRSRMSSHLSNVSETQRSVAP